MTEIKSAIKYSKIPTSFLTEEADTLLYHIRRTASIHAKKPPSSPDEGFSVISDQSLSGTPSASVVMPEPQRIIMPSIRPQIEPTPHSRSDRMI